MKILKIVLLSTLMLLITACHKSSESASNTKDYVNPEGIWIGHQTILTENGKGAFDIKTLIYDGKFYGVSEGANIFYSGRYEISHSKYLIANSLENSNTSYKMYSISENGKPFTNGVTSLTITEQEQLSGNFVNDAYQEGNIESVFTELYNKPSSLQFIDTPVATDSLNISIDESGVLTGSKNDCKVNGNIEIPDNNINMYQLNFTLTECVDSGEYQGLGVVALDNNSRAYFMSFATNFDESRMDSLSYYLENTPSQFLTYAPETRGIFVNDLADYTDTDFTHKTTTDLNPVTLLGTSGALAVNYRDFTGSDFSYFEFLLSYTITQKKIFDNLGHSSYIDVPLVDHHTHVSRSVFDGVNFYRASFNPKDAFFLDSGVLGQKFFSNSFKNANFEESNVDNSIFNPYSENGIEDFILGGQNNLSSAWWLDGRRCGVISFDGCSNRLIDTGLTYEEYKNNKWEVEKFAENLIEKGQNMSTKGTEFVSDAGKFISNFSF